MHPFGWAYDENHIPIRPPEQDRIERLGAPNPVLSRVQFDLSDVDDLNEQVQEAFAQSMSQGGEITYDGADAYGVAGHRLPNGSYVSENPLEGIADAMERATLDDRRSHN